MILPKISIITKLIKRYQRKRKRTIWRGYQYLKKNNQLDLLMQLKQKITQVKLPVSTILSKDIDIELVLRQYLTIRILDTSFNKAILHALGSQTQIIHPLPRVWQRALIQEGIKINHFACSTYWFFYTFFLWIYGIFTAIKYTKNLVTLSKKINHYAYFDQLSSDCFSSNKNSHNVTNWYLQWHNKAKNIQTLCHSIKIAKTIKRDDIKIDYCDVMPIVTGFNKIKYLWSALKICISSVLLLLIGSPYQAILLNQTIQCLLIKYAHKKQLAKDYLFHNSNLFYRPLWTYEAEARGSRIIFYFYSTNDKFFKTKGGEAIQHPWHLLTWGYYLVWNKTQLQYLNYSPLIEEVGPIWFSSKQTTLAKINQRTIAVFSVQAVKISFYITLGAPSEYYTHSIVNQFLLDVHKVLQECNYMMANKPKRKSIYIHPQHQYLLKQLKQQQNYLEINPDLAATTLIQNTQATISMPFTSTALITKAEGKPSVYYDPSGLIQKDDSASNGIPVLIGIDELRAWVKNLDNA